MRYSTVTHKGQVTIPIDVRNKFDIREGDKVSFIILEGNIIALRVKQKADLSSLSACLPKPKKALSVEEINQIIEHKRL